MSRILSQALLLLFVMFLQVVIFNSINIGHGITIYIYVFFILQLPLSTPGWLSLLLGFMLGLGMDAFYNSGGIHAFSLVFTSFARPLILRTMYSPVELENIPYPSSSTMRYNNFLKYLATLVAIHHLLIAILEIFNFKKIIYALPSVGVNIILTTIFISLLDLLIRKERK